MPESTNGPQPSTSSRPRGLIDFIRNSDAPQPALTRDDFDRFVESVVSYRYRRPSVEIMPRENRYGVRVTQYEPPETATEVTPLLRLDADTSTFTQYLNSVGASSEPQFTWHTDELIPYDAITRVDHDYWPDDCASVCPKPKTEQGLQLFFDKHPHLRGAR